MIILILSDEHLRESIRTMGVTLTGDCIWAINQIRELCKQLRPEYVIHAGDIFNQRNISPEELRLFKTLIEATGVKPKNHLTIQGNHDRGKDKAIPQSMGCTSLSEAVITLRDGTTVFGKDYETDPKAMKKYADGKAFNIGVLHYPCIPFNNRLETALCPDDFTDGLTIIGDTHTASLVQKGRKQVLSPGCLFPQNKTELCSGTSVGAWAVNVEKGKVENIYRMPLFQRGAVDLTGISDPSEVRAAVEKFILSEKVRLERMQESWRPPEEIKPVIYINDKVPGVDSDGTYILIRVSGWVEATPGSESLEINSTSFEAIDACMSQLTDDAKLAKKAASLIKDMLATNDSKEPGLTLLNKEGVTLNETQN